MNNKEVLITQEGKEALEAELKHLIEVEKPANIIALEEARGQGDLSENADYDAARDDQTRIEKRIREIQEILKYAKIIEKDNSDLVSAGKDISILYLGINKQFDFKLVGTTEADPFNKKVSIESPLGRSLVGKKTNDVVSFRSESGHTYEVKILSVI